MAPICNQKIKLFAIINAKINSTICLHYRSHLLLFLNCDYLVIKFALYLSAKKTAASLWARSQDPLCTFAKLRRSRPKAACKKSREMRKSAPSVLFLDPKVERVTHQKSCVCKCVELFIILPVAAASSAKSQFVFANRKLFPYSRRQRGFVWKALGRINGFGQIRATLALVVFCVPLDFYLIAHQPRWWGSDSCCFPARRECLFALLMNAWRCWKWKPLTNPHGQSLFIQ